ncbi:hypothetical protein Hanom_Chr12g01096281 [Helianthus anomalus]
MQGLLKETKVKAKGKSTNIGSSVDVLDDEDVEEISYILVDEDGDDSEFHLLSDQELDAFNTPMA